MREWKSQRLGPRTHRRHVVDIAARCHSPTLPLSHSLTLPRSGYTLLELMLVLAIIVVMAAIAYPSATAMYGHLRLSQAADAVRAAWAEARAHAIDEGRPYRFAIIPDQGNYRVAPDSPEFWGSSSQEQASADAINPPFFLNEALPKGL